MIRQFIGYVVENEKLNKNIYRLKIEAEEFSEVAKCGQFVSIKCTEGLDTLLRRPISIMNTDKESKTFDIIFQVKGKGTRYLSEKKKGDSLDIIGPTGNKFTVDEKNKKVAIIGGGIGVFPLYFLLNTLKSFENDVFLGFRSKEFVVMEEAFENKARSLIVGTDDGSYGYNGLIVDCFRNILENNKYDIIYSCGPNPMLREIAKIAKQYNTKCQISLEQRMGCGIGACLVCACKVKYSDNNRGWIYKHVCKDGPVFWSDEVIFDD